MSNTAQKRFNRAKRKQDFIFRDLVQAGHNGLKGEDYQEVLRKWTAAWHETIDALLIKHEFT